MNTTRKFVASAICLAVLSFIAQPVMLGQASTPFVNVLPTVPPAIGQPGVSAAFDITNKLLVVTITANNSGGTVSTLTTFSYNPRSLEGVNGGGLTVSVGGITVILQHNLPADPLKYSIGTATTQLATCVTTTPTTGQTACPALPF